MGDCSYCGEPLTGHGTVCRPVWDKSITGPGPLPCTECVEKAKRIAELEAKLAAYAIIEQTARESHGDLSDDFTIELAMSVAEKDTRIMELEARLACAREIIGKKDEALDKAMREACMDMKDTGKPCGCNTCNQGLAALALKLEE